MKTSNRVLSVKSIENTVCLQRPNRDEIDIGLWGSAAFTFGQSIELLADAIKSYREFLIGNIYRKIKNPLERLAFGFGFAFAEIAGVAPKNMTLTHFSEPIGEAAWICFRIPGYRASCFTWGDVQFFLAHALQTQSRRIGGLLPKIFPWEAAELSIALLCARRICELDGDNADKYFFEEPDAPAEALALQMTLRWMDEWAGNQLLSRQQPKGIE